MRPLVAIGLAVSALAAGASHAGEAGAACPGDRSLGDVAFVRGAGLHVLDLETCRVRTVVRSGVRAPVRWSASGRWIAFSGGVVSRHGRRRFAGGGAWHPFEDLLARETRRGGLVVTPPEGRPRRLLRDGPGAVSPRFDPTGRAVAVIRGRELWTVDLASRRARSVYRGTTEATLPRWLFGWSPNGAWLLFSPGFGRCVSCAADGIPLRAVAVRTGRVVTIVPRMLASEEFFAACSLRLVVAAGADRYTTHAKRLVSAQPPGWRLREASRDRSRSWVSPSCSGDGRMLAASAGPNRTGKRFGLERRSIWLLSPRRRLTTPPPGTTDELPLWSIDNRILFVRTRPHRNALYASGTLHLATTHGRVSAPLGTIGATGNYYGRYRWRDQLDWWRRGAD